MILDNEEQRKILLQVINTTNFPGAILEQILRLKYAIIKAKIQVKEK